LAGPREGQRSTGAARRDEGTRNLWENEHENLREEKKKKI